MLYLDYAATTPMSAVSLRAYEQTAQRFFANTESLHDEGTKAARLLEQGRETVAQLLVAPARGIYFTSGGSEANFLSLLSLARAARGEGEHILLSAVEHASIYQTAEQLKREGFQIEIIPVDSKGIVNIEVLAKMLTGRTILVSICHVNSEVGAVQPLAEIGQLLNQREIFFHSDCVQSFGKVPIKVEEWHLSAVSLSAHKIHGPKGVGACWIAPQIKWEPVFPQVSHEQGFRPGTVNTPGIISFAAACTEKQEVYEAKLLQLRKIREHFLKLLRQQPRIIVEGGSTEEVSPYIVGLRVMGIEGQWMMLECNRRGLAISTGSACRISQQAPSRTLLALGRSVAEAGEFIRVSFSSSTTMEDVERAANILLEIIVEWEES